jgi:hypothetical protein
LILDTNIALPRWRNKKQIMRTSYFGTIALAVLFSFAPLARAGLLGSPVNLNTSETGTVTINPLGGPFASTVGSSAEYSFCVGPNADNCATSGLYVLVDISDTQVSFTFFGGTDPATGTFVAQLSGFNTAITNVTYGSGAIGAGSFGLTSFTNNSMTFTGTVNSGSFAGGGAPVVFNVTTQSVPATPLPSSAILGIVGLGVLGAFYMIGKRRGALA